MIAKKFPKPRDRDIVEIDGCYFLYRDWGGQASFKRMPHFKGIPNVVISLLGAEEMPCNIPPTDID